MVGILGCRTVGTAARIAEIPKQVGVIRTRQVLEFEDRRPTFGFDFEIGIDAQNGDQFDRRILAVCLPVRIGIYRTVFQFVVAGFLISVGF